VRASESQSTDMAASSRRDVILNVYELTDEQGTGSWMRRVGLGAWHTGVEVRFEPGKIPVIHISLGTDGRKQLFLLCDGS
jgi:hypothetical protein